MPTQDRQIEITPVNSYGSEKDAHQTILAELRRDLVEVTAQVRLVVDARTKRAQKAAFVGVEMTRDTIKANPFASIIAATAIGAAVALLVVPPKRRARTLTNIREWAPQVTRADLQEMVESYRRQRQMPSRVHRYFRFLSVL